MASSIQILTPIQTPLICITQTRASKIQILIPWTEPDPDPCLRPTSMPLMLVSETEEDSPCSTGLQPFWARGLAPPPSTWSKNYSGRVWVPRSAFRLLFSLFSQQKKSFFVIYFGAFLGIFFFLLMGSWHINNIAVSSGFGGKHNTKQFATDSQCR